MNFGVCCGKAPGHLTARAASRRGVSLLLCLILLPIAVTGLTLALIGVEARLRDMKRAQVRAQARLLAESALARFLESPPLGGGGESPTDAIAALPKGQIEGAGRYRVERVPGKPGLYAAIGEVPLVPGAGDAGNSGAVRQGRPRLLRHRIDFRLTAAKGSPAAEMLGETRQWVD